MNELKESQGSTEELTDHKTKSQLGADGIRAMQGEAEPSNLDKDHWTARDGTLIHTAVQDEVEDSMGDPDNDVLVYNNEPVALPDGKLGIIDTRVNNTIVDYKTNDMANWSAAEARRYGREHGKQVSDYVNSPDSPKDAKGFIIAAGRPSDNPDVRAVYEQHLAEYGVGVKYPKGGTPPEVAASVQEAFDET